MTTKTCHVSSSKASPRKIGTLLHLHVHRHRTEPPMDQDSPIVHLRPQVNQDAPIVHLRPLAQTKMQARVASAEVFSMFVPTSVPVEAPRDHQPPSASSLCISDDVLLLVLACKATMARKRKQKGTPLLDGAWLELNSPSLSDMPIATQNNNKAIHGNN